MSDSREKERAKIYLQMASDRMNNREYNKALDATEQAIQADPSLVAAYNQLALIYMETKRYQRAEEAFRKALELQPGYPEVFNNLGVLMNREARFQEAIADFEAALGNDKYSTPENALTNLGYSYYRLGQLSRAKEFHRRALDRAPQFCLASKNMGDVYAKEKDFVRAADYFKRAALNCPLYQETQYKLGIVMMKMGHKKVARAQLEKLIQRHKSGPYVERSNEVLRYLQ